MNDLDLLHVLAAELFELQDDPDPEPTGDRLADARARRRKTDASIGIVPWNPQAWFGHPPTPAESAALSRSVRRLERQGYLHIVRGPTTVRVRGLQLTPKALEAVKG